MRIALILFVVILTNSCSLKGEKTYFISGFTSELMLWLDSSDINGDGTNPSNGSSVSVWRDKSGNGNHATSSGTAPKYDSASLNGLGTVLFSDAESLDASLGTMNSPMTVIVLCYFSQLNQAGGNDDYVYSMGANVANTHISIGRYRDAGVDADSFFVHTGPGTDLMGPTLSGQEWLIITQQSNTSATYQTLYVDGTQESPTDFAAAIDTNGEVGIGYFRAGVDGYLWGNIAEILIYKRLLSVSEIVAIENYFAVKWGL